VKNYKNMLALCALASTTAFAQTEVPAEAVVAPVAVETPQPVTQPVTKMAMQHVTLPPNTEIAVTPNDDISSKQLREGDTFLISTMFDVMHSGFVVIPKNTPGKATVTWRTGKGAFGKSAKMEITFNSLDLGNGKTLALTGKHRQEGAGNTGAAVGAVVAVGVFGAFVTGKSANIAHGMQLSARTGETLTFAIPAGVKPVEQAEIVNTPAAIPVT
jgi:hypothetical protein